MLERFKVPHGLLIFTVFPCRVFRCFIYPNFYSWTQSHFTESHFFFWDRVLQCSPDYLAPAVKTRLPSYSQISTYVYLPNTGVRGMQHDTKPGYDVIILSNCIDWCFLKMLVVASVLWTESCEKEFPQSSYSGQHDNSLKVRCCGFSRPNCVTQWLLGYRFGDYWRSLAFKDTVEFGRGKAKTGQARTPKILLVLLKLSHFSWIHASCFIISLWFISRVSEKVDFESVIIFMEDQNFKAPLRMSVSLQLKDAFVGEPFAL